MQDETPTPPTTEAPPTPEAPPTTDAPESPQPTAPAAETPQDQPLSEERLLAAFAEQPAGTEPAVGDGSDAEPEDRVPTGRGLGTGRRKEAVVRVRLIPGEGRFSLNGRSLEDYFPARAQRMTATAPLRVAGREHDFDVIARIHGGGVSGQAGALSLGIARALIDLQASLRPALKAEGFLSRDAREKERRKYGLKKARKAPQYSKR